MYRSLRCQHHLIQKQHDRRPSIPSLTVVGFERWVTLFIQAHPEVEYRRLQKVILNTPINNPDKMSERFPKVIPRRLFPLINDRRSCDRIKDTIFGIPAIKFSNRQQGKSRSRSSIDTDEHLYYQRKQQHVRFVLPHTHHAEEPSSRKVVT